MNYILEHQGTQYTPDGKVEVSDPNASNQATEQQQIDAIKAGCERAFLYVADCKTTARPDRQYVEVITWLGTVLGTAWLGPRANVGFGFHTYRRAITVRMFDTLYHGWYYESSGDYCRLRKAKRQDGQYAATEVRA